MTTRTRYLLALDPGLDLTGWAVYEWPLQRHAIALASVRGLYRESGTLRSSKEDGDEAARLHKLGQSFATVLFTYTPDCIAIEEPAKFGVYARNQRSDMKDQGAVMQGGLSHMQRVIGVMIYVATGFGMPVQMIKAGRSTKRSNHATMRTLLGVRHPTTSNEDQRDAIYLGMRALTNPAVFRSAAPTAKE